MSRGWLLKIPFLWSSWSSGFLRRFAHDNVSERSLLAEALEGTLRRTPQKMQYMVLFGTTFTQDMLLGIPHRSLKMTRCVSSETRHSWTKKNSGFCRCACRKLHIGRRNLQWRHLILRWVLQCRASCKDSTSCPWISMEARVSSRCMGHPGTILPLWVLLRRESWWDSTARPWKLEMQSFP